MAVHGRVSSNEGVYRGDVLLGQRKVIPLWFGIAVAIWAILLLIPLLGCLHRQQRIEREWKQIHEVWQIERADDCDYVDVFKKQDCLKRHSRTL